MIGNWLLFEHFFPSFQSYILNWFMYLIKLAGYGKYVLHISKTNFNSISIDWTIGFFFERLQLNENNWRVLSISVTQFFFHTNQHKFTVKNHTNLIDRLSTQILCIFSHKNIKSVCDLRCQNSSNDSKAMEYTWEAKVAQVK
jgi:hypothetical protein